MNILLTDLNSLKLEVAEIPALPPGGNDNFSRLFRQELAVDIENSSQAADFNDFFMLFDGGGADPDGTAVKAVMATWQEHLSQQEILVTTDADASRITPVEVADGLIPETGAQLAGLDQVGSGTGEDLPAGGISLPPAAASEARYVSQNAVVAPPADKAAAAAPAPGIGQAADATRLLTANRAATAGAETPPAVNLAAAAKEVGVEFAQAAPPLPAGVAAARVNPQESKTAGAPPLVAAPTEAAGISDQRPVFAAGSRTSSAAAAEVDGITPLAQTRSPRLEVSQGRTAPYPLDQALMRMAPDSLEAELAQNPLTASTQVRAAGIKAALPPQQAAGLTDTLSSDDAGQRLAAALPQALKASAETSLLGAEVGPRPADFSAAAQQPQSASTLAAAASQAVSPAVAPSQPLTPPSPLPPQLESMSLARAGEPAEWGDGLGERVSWMINQKQNSATIRLDPPLLGRLDVQVKIADDATTITIQTQHAQTREMIETASVRLRDYLQESGFQNVNVDVSQRQDQQQGRAHDAFPDGTGEAQDSGPDSDSGERQSESVQYSIGEGLLDTFA